MSKKKVKKGAAMTTEPVVPATPQETAADTLGNTRRWARQCHGKQTDKAGYPYVVHLDAVARNVLRIAGWDPELVQAAYLHDFIEDTTGTQAMLRENGFSERVIDTVWSVTKMSGEPNYDYISFIIEAGRDAMIVKLADLYHNTEEARLEHKTITETVRERLEKKYLPAIWRIERALNASGVEVESTVTFEEAKAACQPKPSSYAPKWRESTSPASVVAGDFIKFANDDEDEKHALIVKERKQVPNTTGQYTFTFRDSDSKITLKNGDKFWVKWGGGSSTSSYYGTSTSTTYVPEWMKYMGLPKDWKDGDPLPEPLQTPVYPSYTSKSSKGKGGTSTAPYSTLCKTCHIYNGHASWCHVGKQEEANKALAPKKSPLPLIAADGSTLVDDDRIVEVKDPDTGEHLGTLTIDESGKIVSTVSFGDVTTAEVEEVYTESTLWFDERMREVDNQLDGMD